MDKYRQRQSDVYLKIAFPQSRSIYFVDNEDIFKQAAGRSDYFAYFRDHIDNEFGHFNEKGSQLFAENISKTRLNLLKLDRWIF